jgi:hypothetical protein
MRDSQMGITQALVRDLYFYSEHSGLFFRRKTVAPNARKGHPATKKGMDGYLVIGIKRRNYAAHRIAWLYVHGCLPTDDQVIDHINGDRDDNSIANLRIATHSQNAMNKRRTGPILKGVTRHSSGRYQAQIVVGGKHRYLGLFETPEEAHAAYRKKAKELFGSFARFD